MYKHIKEFIFLLGALGSNGNRLTVSARSAQSKNGRLHNHHVVSGGNIKGLTHPAQPLRRAQKPRCEPLRDARVPGAFTLRSAVTVTVPAEAVGLRTKRLYHHRVMSGNVWDGCKPVRRSYHGRYSHGFAHSERSQGSNM